MNKAVVFAFFLLVIYAGFRVSVDSWNGQVFVYMGEDRAPASVRKLGDYEPLDRRALFSPAHRQLLNHASASREEAFVKVSLGHPLLKTSWGSEFACPVEGHAGLFDKVELTFIGVGITEGGEPPKMVVETDCLPGENLNTLAPILIPMREIASKPAKDREFELGGEHPMNVRLIQMPSNWPEQWVLWNVKLFNQTHPEDALNFGSAKLREANSKLLTFDWK